MSLIYWTKVKQAIDRTPDYIRMREIYKKTTQVDTEGTTIAYQMATKELETSELLEQTPLTTLTEPDSECKLSPGKKKLGPINPDKMEQFVTQTNQIVEYFLQNLHNSEPCAIKEAYQVLITEYHQYLCSIEDYFCHTDRTVVADIIDDKSCKVLKMEKAKEADREKCPDPRTSIDNLMTGPVNRHKNPRGKLTCPSQGQELESQWVNHQSN